VKTALEEEVALSAHESLAGTITLALKLVLAGMLLRVKDFWASVEIIDSCLCRS
jgi:hypothetical protein